MNEQEIVSVVQKFYPDIQALYIYGSFNTEFERPDSDLDMALLLPPETARKAGNLILGDCWSDLSNLLNRQVDLINLRNVNTVFQHQIIQTGHLLFKGAAYETELFEMLVISFYQKLNDERSLILEDIAKTKKVLLP